MNPPIRQKLIHNRALRREHIRILLAVLLLPLFLRELGTVVHRLSTDDSSIARLHDPARGVRWRPEFVGLF